MNDIKRRVCPVERAGSLDNRFRRWLQNPEKILGPYVKEGMRVLDFGCGPGFFSIDMAYMVGKSGQVVACDLQKGMLQKLKDKIVGTEIEDRITIHQCNEDQIGWSEKVDFILAFYMIHELPNPDTFFAEIGPLLNSEGQVFIVEPPFHVSKTAFEETVQKARNAGFMPVENPKVLLSKTVVLKKQKVSP